MTLSSLETVICLKCNLVPARMKSPKGDKGFCDQCWSEVYKKGSCVVCGSKDELTPLVKWYGIILEEICYYCYNSQEY